MNTDDGMLPLSDDEFSSLENINPQELDKDLSLDEIIQEILNSNSGKIHDLATRWILKDKFKRVEEAYNHDSKVCPQGKEINSWSENNIKKTGQKK